MNNRRQHVAACFADAASRIDMLLSTWGFTFAFSETQASHCGPYATGVFMRGQTKISLSCRDTIENIFYEHTFAVKHHCCTEIERFSIGHATLMEAVGHDHDCHLIVGDDYPNLIMARDGGDRAAALIYDLSHHAAELLRIPNDDFFSIVRRGIRSYSIN